MPHKVLLVLLAIIGLTAFCAFEWLGKGAWAEHCRLLRAQGHPIQAVPIKQPQGPPRQAVAKLEKDLEKAERMFVRAEALVAKNSPPGPGGRPEDLITWAQALTWLQSGKSAADFQLNSTETNSVARVRAAETVLKCFSAYDQVFERVRFECRRPGLVYPFGYSSNSCGQVIQVFPAINVCRRLRLKTYAQLATGRTAEALRELDLVLCLADSLRSDSVLISGIGNVACRTVGLQPFREALFEHRYGGPDLRQLESMLCSDSLVEDLPRVVRGERDATVSLYDSGALSLLLRTMPGRRCLVEIAFNLMPSRQKLGYSEAIERVLTSGYVESEKRIMPGAFENAEKGLSKPLGLRTVFPPSLLSELCLPRVSEFARNCAATQVTTDHLRIGCGLELYFLKHGDYPQELVQLVPDFISALPQDPIAGKSYRYQRTAEGGYKLWSVGADGTDEGGISGGERFDSTPGDWVTEVGSRMRTAPVPQNRSMN